MKSLRKYLSWDAFAIVAVSLLLLLFSVGMAFTASDESVPITSGEGITASPAVAEGETQGIFGNGANCFRRNKDQDQKVEPPPVVEEEEALVVEPPVPEAPEDSGPNYLLLVIAFAAGTGAGVLSAWKTDNSSKRKK